MIEIAKELVNEFIATYCIHCDAYVICDGECAGCKDFDKFLKEQRIYIAKNETEYL